MPCLMTGEDKDILSILQRNSEKGFRLLMGKYQEPVYWHIRRLVVSHDDAQDATQETFVRVFRNLGQVKKKDSFAAWIYRIATNEAFRILDARKAETMDLDASQENIKSLMFILSIYSKIIIKPNETFSFWTTVGKAGKKQGYKLG